MKLSTSYHLETDGQSEVFNKTIETYLRAMVHDVTHQWREALPWAELWYNTVHHHSLGTTPYQAVFGCPPPELIGYQKGDSLLPAVDAELVRRKVLLESLKNNLLLAQRKMKRHVDEKRRPYLFNVEDKVWLKLHPYRQHSVERWKFQKLGKKLYGPLEILKKINDVAFRLRLLESSSIFPVFHVSLLKRFKGADPGQTP